VLILKRKLFNILEILLRWIPISKKIVLFLSFDGQFNDNPLYIYEELIKRNHKMKFIWLISSNSIYEKSFFRSTKNTKFVKIHSLRHLYYSRRAKVIIDNGAGYKTIISGSKKTRLYRLFKKRKQLNISTWHGTPMKKIGINIPNIKTEVLFTTSDYLLSGSRYTTTIFKESFPFKGMKIIETGTPRTDILLSKDNNRDFFIKNKIGVARNEKIILFAPTYRDNPNDSGLNQMQMIDFSKLMKELKTKFGGEWVFVYRIHQMSRKLIRDNLNKFISNDVKTRIIDGNNIEDMNEVLSITDVLITDYSGALYDFSLTKKPCFIFAHDFRSYQNNRGMNINIFDLPFSISVTFEELLTNIKQFNQNKYENDIKDFLIQIGNVEDGKASKRVADIIVSAMKKERE
jgi:CDP-glycerol glycerophosphotransferase